MLNKRPYLLVSDEQGNIFELKEYEAVGRTGIEHKRLKREDFIELPNGSELFFLPGRKPVGYHTASRKIEVIDGYHAVSAFVAPAYTQTYMASYEKTEGACLLPLYAYSSIGWLKGKHYTTAVRIDSDRRQDPDQFYLPVIEKRVKEFRKKYKGNRLVEHLAENCALNYHCRAAQNYFLGRWECPLPTSRVCNAGCQACLSMQPEENTINPAQFRITFKPSVQEIVEIAVDHLENAPLPVVSFGQGCEGEPLLETDLILESITEIRKKTAKGIINLNTNASKPMSIEKLCRAGLQSIRVSMNSAVEDWYNRYFNPKNYTFNDVLESIKVARAHQIWISVNYFVFPGLTDSNIEFDAFEKLVLRKQINMIQWRNFNIDPDWYIEKLGIIDNLESMSMQSLFNKIKHDYPNIAYGYFNPSQETMSDYGKTF